MSRRAELARLNGAKSSRQCCYKVENSGASKTLCLREGLYPTRPSLADHTDLDIGAGKAKSTPPAFQNDRSAYRGSEGGNGEL
jgi:hypothetical protein